jgi:hypothetical protein
MEAICSSGTSAHTRFARRLIPEDGILHNHRRENLKSYTSLPINLNERKETFLKAKKNGGNIFILFIVII